MTITENTRRLEDDTAVETLLNLPKKNLESRIIYLQTEINERLQIQDSTLSSLGTSRLKARDRDFRFRYAGLAGQGIQPRQEFVKEVLQLEQQMTAETVGCFRDLSVLRERLQKAREDLAFEEEKARLLG